ncbi:MAG: FGGY-family carbohydrate kinase [Opitutaceae bacterium]|nr:FGGY-family carbohydrate kinase [Opitutaceae bacterium]
MPMLLGIDLGTSYLKAGVFERDGTLRGLGRVALGAVQPAPERMEVAVADFWARLRLAVGEALAGAGVAGRKLAGVSYSSQANSFVLLDRADCALTPLILWPDRRAAPLDAETIAFGQAPAHGPVTGMTGAVPERMPAKWRWLVRHEPALSARTQRILTISDYLVHGLTGEANGDASTAALTGLLSLPSGEWWPEALTHFGLREDQLSRPRPPGSLCGQTISRATERLGLPAGIPFAAGALDHHAAAIGAGVGGPVDASLSIGTVLAALALVDDIGAEPGCIHGGHFGARRYFRLTYDPNGAGQFEAYQRKHAPDQTVEQLLDRAGRPTASRHGAAVHDLLVAMAGTLRGLLVRAAGPQAVRSVAVTGGGARSGVWLQVTADVLGVPVRASPEAEQACLGAAMLAAVGAGVWPDLPTAMQRMAAAPRIYRPAKN